MEGAECKGKCELPYGAIRKKKKNQFSRITVTEDSESFLHTLKLMKLTFATHITKVPNDKRFSSINHSSNLSPERCIR